ncbi:MAG: hypothetical protein KIS30_03595 [Thermoplasmata archaeon]|nr:hypothetical protein [Candidatus Sysuiplasma acidicola]MBX8645828.1 hypothetical protein [Candidatus Sysuiplasma acidicola]MDH2905727.1 hypothetical protein [Methanomassiliicoccales archaeon]
MTVQETDETMGNENVEKDAPGRRSFEITDNLVILLLIVFTVIIGAWWFLNLYMGRWIH